MKPMAGATENDAQSLLLFIRSLKSDAKAPPKREGDDKPRAPEGDKKPPAPDGDKKLPTPPKDAGPPTPKPPTPPPKR
jgi:hypothetical protein